jgi:gas vesicle protein
MAMLPGGVRMSQDEQEQEQEHTQDSQSNLTGNVVWFLTGALLGAAVAILYAPQSGKETRRYLSKKAQQSKDAVADTSSSIVEAGKDMFDRGRQLVDDAADLFERGRKLVKG